MHDDPRGPILCFGEEVGEHLFVTLFVPPDTLNRDGVAVGVLGFTSAQGGSHEDVVRGVGAAVVAIAKGERLP